MVALLPLTDVAAPQVLSDSGRRLASRFSFGVTPALTAQIVDAGGARAWWDAQLAPDRLPDPRGDEVNATWFPRLRYTPAELWHRHVAEVAYAWDVMADLGRRTMMRRIVSTRQVHEVMVDFWSNLLHVPLGDDDAWVHRVAYDAMIRRNALARFEDLLIGATTHAAMGIYLDNATSTKYSPNENLGRELLELHSVGVDAGYGERDVRHSSHMLTGYTVDWWNTFDAYYDPDIHYTGPLRILGFRHANRDPDGRAATVAYLRYLARHPATAKRIAHRLCVRFVSDDPSDGIVRAVATTFRKSGTDIRATLRTLIEHPEFTSARVKVRTPLEDYLATARALNITAHKPTRDDAFANAAYWQAAAMGQTPYGWPAPDGFPEDGASWISVGRVLGSFDVHLLLSAGWWPHRQVTYRNFRHWRPPLPARFGDVVDHMSRLVLGEPVTPALLTAASQRVGIGPATRVAAADLPEWRITPLLALLLDSPAHMNR